MARGKGGATALAAGVTAAALVLVLSLVLAGPRSAAAGCNPPADAVDVDPSALPATQVGTFGQDQLGVAAQILAAGRALGLGVRDQTIGVMTALGESSLRALDHGDAVGPDSRGVFQQRDNGAWGTLADRMDPFASASNFFRALAVVEGRESLEPTIVAHRVQRNADPFHYARFWDDAVAIVEAFAGTDLPLTPGTGGQVCTGQGVASQAFVNTAGWASPGAGPVVSRFGMRANPGKVNPGQYRLHAGTDLAGGGCDGPIYAVADGVVIDASLHARVGGVGVIAVDHGAGVTTRCLHMYASGILVRVGQQVTAGQQIGRVGSSGNSTGCHLHFETLVNGSPTDPEPYMATVGITLGSQRKDRP